MSLHHWEPMLEAEGQRPEPYQPRATPWVKARPQASPEGAAHLHRASHGVALSGLMNFSRSNPGRCPGLVWSALVGALTSESAVRTWPWGEIAKLFAGTALVKAASGIVMRLEGIS